MQDIIKINEDDQVAVALKFLKKGKKVSLLDQEIIVKEDIPQGHKFAIVDMKAGSPVMKYGACIGYAKSDIPMGAWVHVHNLKTSLSDLCEYEYYPVTSLNKDEAPATFLGYKRENGKVGVRNEIWIVPTVGCVNSVAKAMEIAAKNALVLNNVDDIVAFAHPYGCSQMGEDQEATRNVLADIAKHPNAGGVLLVGLGCENCNLSVMEEYIDDRKENVYFLQCQDFEDEIEEGVRLLKKLYNKAETFEREECSSAELIIGMKCGGSDGLSGITANPIVGTFSDMLIGTGGTTILTEVPEMFGAETILMNRCKNKEVFNKTVSLINDFKSYFKSHNQTIYENPSPGNKEGGISTLEDKSLGCTQKSGIAPVVDVLKYAEIVKEKGLNLLSAPGNDLVATTALAVSGAQIVLFTTGRGTPFASLVPTIKISSNTTLSKKKKNWIDFDAGELVEDKSKEQLSKELFDFVLKVASGEKVKSEMAGYHDIAIFKQGVTL